MRRITDWHVHSRFSRACSQNLTLENNALWCQKKGVDVLGTADFTHPVWFQEIEKKLVEAEPGLFTLADGQFPDMRYMLTTEVSQIYKKHDKTRRIHNLILAPSLEAVRKTNQWLLDSGFNLKADGRPILGLDSEELYKRLKDIDDRMVVIPAHAWTPWFSVFGSKSGFDSLEECFGSMAPHIFAIETGLSSDALMNRSCSMLDSIALISNSDAHSPEKFGREANVFDLEPHEFSFDGFMKALRDRDTRKFLYTIEFYPEEGKYHVDGHADCGIALHPHDTKKHRGLCPKCKRPLTIGVMSRVADLHDRELASMPNNHVPQRSIVPLPEILAEVYGVVSPSSKKVKAMYDKMIPQLGNEFQILLDTSISDIQSFCGPDIAEAIRRVRGGEMSITPGYDGVFGKVKIFAENERKSAQKPLLLP
ncbi:MAG TPA: endonuclease Q family protein [bacterium]|nr:endonuclease Q family protein [bacterium]